MLFTAIFLNTVHGYVGFIEELPLVNSHGMTLDEARERLRELVALVFDEQRRNALELTAGKEVVRESFAIPLAPAWQARAAACVAPESAP
jgi:predicted RNase H-like HicB family nuclease